MALALGAVTGLLLPAVAGPARVAVNPVLGLLLYATFLGVPFSGLVAALRDGRFLLTLAVVNFLVVPVVVLALSRTVADDRALLVGVLLVLLCPCVDYVVVFAGLAGGSPRRLLAATPLLMLVQLLLLPLCLRLMAGRQAVSGIDARPLVQAFLLLVLLPLVAAGLTQLAASRLRAARALRELAPDAAVPLMMLTLAVVVASQVHAVGGRLGDLLRTVPVYVGFVVVMVLVGSLVTRWARLEARARRTVVLSGVTRNSLVVLPLAVALPRDHDLAPLAVVTQTLVELVLLVGLVHVLPRLVPER